MTSHRLPLEVPPQEPPGTGSGSWWTYTHTLIFSLCVGVTALVVILLDVWWQSGSFWPEAIPPYVQYLGEDYSCQGLPAPDSMAGLTLQGFTAGGGLIYARPPIDSHAAEGWIVVTDGHRREACIYNGED